MFVLFVQDTKIGLEAAVCNVFKSTFFFGVPLLFSGVTGKINRGFPFDFPVHDTEVSLVGSAGKGLRSMFFKVSVLKPIGVSLRFPGVTDKINRSFYYHFLVQD